MKYAVTLYLESKDEQIKYKGYLYDDMKDVTRLLNTYGKGNERNLVSVQIDVFDDAKEEIK